MLADVFLNALMTLLTVFMAAQSALLDGPQGLRGGSTSRGHHIALYLGLLTVDEIPLTGQGLHGGRGTRHPSVHAHSWAVGRLGCGQAGLAADKRSVVWLRCSSEGHSLRRRETSSRCQSPSLYLA